MIISPNSVLCSNLPKAPLLWNISVAAGGLSSGSHRRVGHQSTKKVEPFRIAGTIQNMLAPLNTFGVRFGSKY